MRVVRRDFPSADGVPVGGGEMVIVFNIGGNKYRLVTAIHYNTGILYTLRVPTHADYNRGRWKHQL